MKKQVAVILGEYPHYRREVLSLLSVDHRYDLKFYAGAESRTPGIDSFTIDGKAQFRHIRNYRLGPLWLQPGAIAAFLRSGRDGAVLLGDPRVLSTWLLLALGRVMRRPVLLWTIGWNRPDSRVVGMVRRLFYRLSTGLLVYGERGAALGRAAGFPAAKLFVVGNSVSEVAGGPLEATEVGPRSSSARTIVSVGRLTAVKRLDLLIEAVATDAVLQKQARVTLVGDGPEMRALREQAHERGVDVTFLGAVHDSATLHDIYRGADVAVIPGAAGLGVIQAMKNGVPVITHDDPNSQMPESEAVRPGLTGDLFRNGSAESLAEKLREWTQLSPAERSAVSRRCIQEVDENWSPAVHARRIGDGMDKLMGRQ